ncbi:MAG: hypothetical protein ABSA17_08550 [Rhabdochlamydiaceae bacterium]|jgi:hypothetical protein
MQLIRAIPIFALFLFAVLNSDKLIGVIQLTDVMSQDEQKKTGVSQLNNQQKQELEKWVNEKFILKPIASEAPMPSLQQNLNNGSRLELTDGSIYEIAPSDQARTAFWISPIAIKVSASNDPMFPVELTNTLTGVTVRAKQVRAATIKPQTNPNL